MVISPSRIGAMEYVQFIFPDATEADPDNTDTYDVRVIDFTVDFIQGVNYKEYVEKGIDSTVYTLGGTTVTATLSAIFNSKDFGIYKLIDFALQSFEDREAIQPATFQVFSSYYGKLHDCVVESIDISMDESGPIAISVNIVARYIDYTEREIDRITSGYKDMEEARNFMFFDSIFDFTFYSEEYHWPVDLSAAMNGFSLNITNEILKTWTLDVNTDAEIVDTELLPQKITAAKYLAIGGREISGSLSYLMPHDDLYGFFKVLGTGGPLQFFIEDTLNGDTEYMHMVIDEAVFNIPSKPIMIATLTQTTEFRAIRPINSEYYDAISYDYIDEEDMP